MMNIVLDWFIQEQFVEAAIKDSVGEKMITVIYFR